MLFNRDLLKQRWITPDFSPVVIPERLAALNHDKYNRLVGGMVLKYSIPVFYLKSGTIIDICCGSGFGASILSKSGYKVIGVDSDPQIINICKLRETENLKFTVGNLMHMDRLNVGKFDCVTLINAIEHFQKE